MNAFFNQPVEEQNAQYGSAEPDETRKKKVLITGVAGFIGSHVAKHCLNLGFHVVGIDDLSGGFKDNIPEGVDFHLCDIRDKGRVHNIFEANKPEYVYHLAAYAAENLSHFIRNFNYDNNLVGGMNVINACVLNDVKCIVFTSSIAVYGDRYPPFSEDEPVTPKDPYAISKWATEVDLHCAREMFGLNYVIFRPGNVYGPGQNIGDKYRNVIGIFMNQIMTGQPLTVFGDGTQTRAFSYIDDVAPHIARAAMMPEIYNHTFNIGGGQQYTVKHLIEVIAEEFQCVPQVKYLEKRQETKNAYSNIEKAEQVFGRPWTALRQGVAKMAEWARKVGPRQSPEFAEIEIRKNLPEGW
jgi:UDP-glucose 4-epimerase